MPIADGRIVMTERCAFTLGGTLDPTRLARWNAILQWWGHSAIAIDVSRITVPPNSWVMSVGETTTRIANELAAASERQSFTVASMADAEQFVGRTLPASLLVISPRKALGFETLVGFQGLAQKFGFALGFLTGIDLPGIAFAAAKSWVSHFAPVRTEILSLDVISHQLPRDELSPRSAPALDRWEAGLGFAQFLGHGEGAHMLMGDAVICGLTGPREAIDEVAVDDGCSLESCKRATRTGLAVRRAKDLRAQLAVFMSCNSVSVADQMYPSSSSLVLASLEGYASAVLGNPWSVDFSAVEVERVKSCLSDTDTLGMVTSKLNAVFSAAGRLGQFSLFGDPAAPCPGPRGLGDKGEAAISRNQHAIIVHEVEAETASIQSARDTLLRELAIVARGHHRTTRFLTILRHAGSNADSAESASLKSLDALSATLGQSILRASRHLNSPFNYKVADGAQRKLSQARDAAARWDLAFASHCFRFLLSGSIVGDRILALKRELAACAGEVSTHRCRRCGVAAREMELNSLDATEQMILATCPLCGPLACHGKHSRALTLIAPVFAQQGQTVELQCEWTAPADLGASDGFLLLEARDKTRPKPIQRSVVPHRFEMARTSMSVQLPLDAGSDQHSVRVIWIGGLDLVYARAVFSVTPARR